MAEVKIVVFDDGPIQIDGPISVADENGKEIKVVAGESVFLCRCGASTDKPFCDGSHQDCEFKSKLSK